ncbi:MAG: translation initiation factor IF-2 [Alistipes sp.]|nr:translation initiation factor IF-2 [Candidatus Minthomonas equi]
MTGNDSVRISKVIKEFNIGMNTLVDFLKKKGFDVESNPNTKIDGAQYELVAKEFRKEQMIKEQSSKIAIKFKEITEKEHSPLTEDEQHEQELLIKSTAISSEPAPTPVLTQEPIQESEDIPQKKEVEETVSITPVPEKDDSKESETETHVEPSAEESKPATEPEQKQEPTPAPAYVPAETEIKVLGHINLNEVNKPVKPVKEEVQPVEDIAKQNEKEEIEHIETKVEKLEGIKKVGTVDLSKFDKKPSPADHKVKRERIKKSGREKVDITKGGIDKPRHQQQNSQNGIQGGKTNQQNNRNNQGGGKKNRNKDRFKPIHTEIDEDQIQKQIKETYARMTEGKGKTKTSKHKRDKRELYQERLAEEQEIEQMESNILKVTEFVTANELATMMSTPVTKVIEACMNLGLMVSINQRLDAEALVLVAEEFGYKIEFTTADEQEAIEEDIDSEKDLVPRPPIITVMGHVDHGKTSLLDYIRKSNVIAGEAGGITQHIGAYNVKLPDGRHITFLDTPGHEAFTAMRARGAKITDLVIIVVAADDAIMPQTLEAIAHSQAAGVPMIFAINKIDKPGAHPDKIREQLANMNILVEEWGGKYQCQEISAKQGLNIDKLLEKVLLEADMLDLKANPDRRAKGSVIESSLDKGRGYLATILVQNGTLHVGDIMLSGCFYGKVKAMFNERGQKVTEAGPSTPVSVLGLNGAPTAGEAFNVFEDEREAKDLANKRDQLLRIQGLKTQKHITLEEIGRRIAIGNFKELSIIVKGDVDGSVEALSDSLIKLSTEEVHVDVIHKAVGAISESDVLLAAASNAIIIGFQVRPSAGARKLAEKEEIEIRQYSIIYDAINEIKSGIEGMLAPEEKEEVTANAEVRETFRISKVGTIAGCMVKDGKLTRTAKVRVTRDGIVIHTGVLGSLKRFKDDAKEVPAGMDCGLNIESFNDIQIGDLIEAYQIVQIKRKL